MGNVTKLQPSPGKAPGFQRPEPISNEMALLSFDCGKPPLDDWLRYKALKSEGRSARTYVVCQAGIAVGYYCFVAGSVRREELPRRAQRNMPTIVPTFLIGRLAVDRRVQGMGIGKGLLKDAMLRSLSASEIVGGYAVMVHALDDEAASFYQSFDFQPFPSAKQTFFLPVESIALAYDDVEG